MYGKWKQYRVIVAAAVAVVAVLCLSSCSKEGDTIYQSPPEDLPAQSPLVTVVYDPDALGDRSYNDLIYKGVEQAAKEHGLRTLQLSPSSRQEGLAYLENLFTDLSTRQDTIRRLVIVTSPLYDEFLRKNNRRLEKNPRADLLYLETRTPLEGKGSTLYVPYYGAMFEAGAIAVHFSSEVLLVGANPRNESVKDALQGFRDGFATDIFPYNREKTLNVEYLGSAADEGFSIEDTTAMKFLIDREDQYVLPLLVPVCGGAAGTFHRMNETLQFCFIMGVDVPMVSTSCPYSAVKRVDRAVAQCITQWLSSDGMPKHQSLGLADDFTGVEIHTVSSLMSIAFHGELTDDILKAAHDEAVRKEAEYER